jgi:hypothetical protein
MACCWLAKICADSKLGGLIALGLSQGWSLDHCINIFPKLVAMAFEKRTIFGFKMNTILDTLVSFASDCIYPTKHIESALTEAFGEDTRLLNCSFATRNNIRIAIPVATTRESALCLFTSYNGISNIGLGLEQDDEHAAHYTDCDPGYHVIHPNDSSQRVKVWEV